MDEKTMNMIADIMDTITQTDEWNATASGDPWIAATSRKFSDTLDSMESVLTFDQIGEINTVSNLCVAAHVDAAIIYGMRVAFALMDTIKSPRILSLYSMERMERNNHEGH